MGYKHHTNAVILYLSQIIFDYIFIQNPYNLSKKSALDPHYCLEGLKKITQKLVYIVYGPHLFHQDTYNQDTYNNKGLKKLIDIVFVDSDSTKQIFLERFNFEPEQVVVSGYPNYKNIRDMKIKYKKSNVYKETILWLPRWTLHFRYRDLHEGGSTFLSYYHFFYNFAQENKNTLLIIRPHALLFQYGIDSKFLSQKDANKIINKFKKLNNVAFSEHISVPLENDMLQADIVISDGSSALGEAIVTDKPIIYLSNGWDNEFESNTLAKEFKDFLYFAHDPLEIILHLNTIRSLNYTPVASQNLIKWQNFKQKVDPVENPNDFIVTYIEQE